MIGPAHQNTDSEMVMAAVLVVTKLVTKLETMRMANIRRRPDTYINCGKFPTRNIIQQRKSNELTSRHNMD